MQSLEECHQCVVSDCVYPAGLGSSAGVVPFLQLEEVCKDVVLVQDCSEPHLIAPAGAEVDPFGLFDTRNEVRVEAGRIVILEWDDLVDERHVVVFDRMSPT